MYLKMQMMGSSGKCATTQGYYIGIKILIYIFMFWDTPMYGQEYRSSIIFIFDTSYNM